MIVRNPSNSSSNPLARYICYNIPESKEPSMVRLLKETFGESWRDILWGLVDSGSITLVESEECKKEFISRYLNEESMEVPGKLKLRKLI